MDVHDRPTVFIKTETFAIGEGMTTFNGGSITSHEIFRL